MVSFLVRVHTRVYVEKRPCHYYGDQSHLQLEHGVTFNMVENSNMTEAGHAWCLS